MVVRLSKHFWKKKKEEGKYIGVAAAMANNIDKLPLLSRRIFTHSISQSPFSYVFMLFHIW